MSTAVSPAIDLPAAPSAAPPRTMADLLRRLGVGPERVLFRPYPATEQDVSAVHVQEGRLCELIEGVLVEKAVGYTESILAVFLAEFLNAFVRPRNLGLVSGADGTLRLFPGLIRIPDAAFAGWDRFPNRRRPAQPIPDVVPDLAVEVLSESNTPAEMARKCGEYFTAGVRLVWLVDPGTRTVAVYTAVDQVTTLGATQTLTRDPVLSGFSLPLADLFAELDRAGGA
jgi:Uma2 family endonuclease